MQNQKKEIAQFNEAQFKSVLNELESKTEFIQEFVTKYSKFNLRPLNGAKELEELFYNPKKLFVEKISSGEKVTIKGLNVNDEKLFDLLEKPKGMTELIEELTSFNKDRVKTNFYSIRSFTVTDNLVSISENVIKAYKEANTIYIENEKQKKVYEATKEALKALNTLKSLNNINLSGLSNIIKESNGTFKIDATFLKTIK